MFPPPLLTKGGDFGLLGSPPSRKNWILGWEIQLAIVAFEPLDELRLIFLDSQIVVPRLKQELALASSNTIHCLGITARRVRA